MKPIKEIETLLITKYRKKLWAPFVRAIEDYKLIADGDRVGIAISGGKDSLLMAKLFQQYQREKKNSFELAFFCMDPGYNLENRLSVMNNLEALDIPANIFETPIFEASLKMSSKTPCFMCAKMRRGALYQAATDAGCNKLALGHHYDDVIETTLMNVLCGGEFKTMLPKIEAQNFEAMALIRPLYLIREADIIQFCRTIGLEPLNCGCSVTEDKGDSRRAEIKKLIQTLSDDYQNVAQSIFSAAKNVRLDHVLGYTYKDTNTGTEIRRGPYDGA